MSSFFILKQRNFFLLWVGQLTSSMGDALHALALMWLTLQLTGSSVQMSMVVLSQVLPKLLFGLLGGGYADRWERRKTMIVSDVIRGVAVLAIPFLYKMGELHMWHLYGVAFILGTIGCFFDPANQSMMPSVVRSEDLGTANGWMDASARSCRIFVPMLLGVLTVFLPLYLFFVVDSITFFVSASTLLLMNVRSVPSGDKRRNVWQEIGATMREVAKWPRIYVPTLAVAIGLSAWNGAYQVGIPLLVYKQLQLGISAYSFLIGAYGVANVLASVVYDKLPIRDLANGVMAGWFVTGAGFLLMGFSATMTWAIIGAMCTAFGGPIATLSRVTLIQREVGREQMGKVFALGGTLNSIGIALSLAVTGPIFQGITPSHAFFLYGGVIVAVSLIGSSRLQQGNQKQLRDAEAKKQVTRET